MQSSKLHQSQGLRKVSILFNLRNYLCFRSSQSCQVNIRPSLCPHNLNQRRTPRWELTRTTLLQGAPAWSWKRSRQAGATSAASMAPAPTWCVVTSAERASTSTVWSHLWKRRPRRGATLGTALTATQRYLTWWCLMKFDTNFWLFPFSCRIWKIDTKPSLPSWWFLNWEHSRKWCCLVASSDWSCFN